jgi:hypothetical protein
MDSEKTAGAAYVHTQCAVQKMGLTSRYHPCLSLAIMSHCLAVILLKS